jgi:hypothetical protein
MNNNETFYNKIYIICTSLKFYGLILIMFLTIGIGPGYPGIRNYLIESGVYSNLCKNNTNNCKEQLTKLDNVANLSLTLLNATTLIGGIFVDILGNKLTGIIGMILWIISMSISGLNPKIGINWEIGFLIYNIASILVFFPTLFLYIPSIFKNNTSVIACALAIITGIWDLSGMALTLLSDLINALDNKPSIQTVFILYGTVFGGLSLIYIIYNFGYKEDNQSNNQNNNNTICQNIKNQFISTRYYLSNIIYWAYVFNTIIVVTYGYFFIAQLTLYLEWKGLNQDDIITYNHNFTYLFAIIGCITSILMGLSLLGGDESKNILFLIIVEFISALLMSTGIYLPSTLPIKLQYLTFVFFIIWRITGFTFVNSTFSIIFESNIGYGKALGILYSVSGIFGVILGKIMEDYIQDDLNNFNKINIIFTILSLVSPMILYYLIRKRNVNINNSTDYNLI